MNTLPTDISDIIYEYAEQIITAEKYKKCLEQLNEIAVFTISLCKYCRSIRVQYDIVHVRDTSCNHQFFLSKSIYSSPDKKYFLKSDPFKFHCATCNVFDTFFSHLHI